MPSDKSFGLIKINLEAENPSWSESLSSQKESFLLSKIFLLHSNLTISISSSINADKSLALKIVGQGI